MKRSGQTRRKLGIAAAAAAVLLIAGGFGINILSACSSAPADGPGTEISETENAEAFVFPAEEPLESGFSGARERRENRLSLYLTYFAQQGIGNMENDLDEDAELIQFAFRYRYLNDPDSIPEQEENGVRARTLTLEQVNETLTFLLGKTVSPGQEEYRIRPDEPTEFRCFFQDGRFCQVLPISFDDDRYYLRFAKVESYDEENRTVRFRVYRANPANWTDAEIHFGLLPAISIEGYENKRDIVTMIATGDAVLGEFGGDLKVTQYVTQPLE